ncbi:hypothetical protein PR003_g18888 [Phytophthora rubi]|uniref:Uncharacterized protein n=3 Tax=Phytophthora rubi TaxID=129364 RepID=A0A6A4E254_9STRA|nr:hypothetical protein PR002_g18131 [Phytophthora rubi]KAE9315840.1 hypothetical protein PR003_g18888 [Phytophthora rubi]
MLKIRPQICARPAESPPVSAGDSSDIYGTFDGRQVNGDALLSSPAASSLKSAVFRVAGLAGVLLVAGYATSSGFQTLQSVNSVVTLNEQDGAAAGDSPLLHNVALETELNDVEQQLVDGVDAAHIREFLHVYSSKPHIAGSKADYETARYTVEKFESFGLKTEIKEYYTLLSTPVRRRLAILEPKDAAQELNLTEASVAGDACTTDATAEPPFLAYSPSGNVTAPVVYANYGSQQDFQ